MCLLVCGEKNQWTWPCVLSFHPPTHPAAKQLFPPPPGFSPSSLVAPTSLTAADLESRIHATARLVDFYIYEGSPPTYRGSPMLTLVTSYAPMRVMVIPAVRGRFVTRGSARSGSMKEMRSGLSHQQELSRSSQKRTGWASPSFFRSRLLSAWQVHVLGKGGGLFDLAMP